MADKLTDIEHEANQELAGIAAAQCALDLVQADYDRERAKLDERFSPLFEKHRAKKAIHEAELNSIMMEQTDELFGDQSHRKDTMISEKIDLPNGSLLWKVKRPVKRIRKLRQVIIDKGFWFLLRPPAAPPVNWDAVEVLNDAALKILGTERRKVETFEYETAGRR
jgi:hypothetical protein